VGSSFKQSEAMDGTMFTIRLSNGREMDFRFHSIFSVVVELLAQTLLPEGVKILEGGWLYCMNGVQKPELREADLELQLAFSMAVWTKYLQPTDVTTVFPFFDRRNADDCFMSKEVERIISLAKVGEVVRGDTRSLFAATFMKLAVKKQPSRLPDVTNVGSKRPAWWKLVDSIWFEKLLL
jgi:hypothetical protein